MRMIVTGGAGFIGSHLVDRLLADGAEVVVVDNFDPFYPRDGQAGEPGRRPCTMPRFRLVELDIRDGAGVDGAWSAESRPDAIVHLAARAGRPAQHRGPGALRRRQRARGPSTCSRRPRRLEPRPRFVYASSSSVYGDRPDAPFRETDPVDLPVSPYAATKKACELLAYTFHHLHGLPVTGPAVLHRVRAAEPPRPGDRQVRPADRPRRAGADVRRRHHPARLHVRRRHRRRHRPRRRPLHGASPLQPGQFRARSSCATLIDAIGAALGKTPRIERLPEQPGDVRQTYADIHRASTELGYSPKTPFREGLAHYVAWYRANQT